MNRRVIEIFGCKDNPTTYDESPSNIEILCDYFFYARELYLMWGMKKLYDIARLCDSNVFFPVATHGHVS
jgi:hypothetical protein